VKIGILFATTQAAVAQAHLTDAFRQGMRELGYVAQIDQICGNLWQPGGHFGQ